MIELCQRDVRTDSANRLTIAGLLLWMLGTGASLAMERWKLDQMQDPTWEMLLLGNTSIITFSPLNGASLAFLMLVLARWWQGRATIPSEPGHWYLAFQGLSLVIGWLADVIRLTQDLDFEPPLRPWFDALWPTAIFAFPVMLALIGCVKVRANIWWRAMLVLLAVPGIAVIAHASIQTPLRRWYWLISEFGDGTLDRAVWSLPAVAALVATLYDWKRKRTHDIFHWIGIASLWLAIALEWPFWLWWWQVYR